MNEKRGYVLRQTFGLMLVVLLLAGCGGASTQPTATPAPEKAAIVSTTAPSPTDTIEPTTPPTATAKATMPPPTATPEPTAPAVGRGEYLGQTPPGLTPEIFAPGIISTGDFEFAGTFSPDGREFFFTRRRSGGNRIWYTRLDGDGWTTPELAPFACDCFEFEPHITPDGQRLYFGSRRPLPNDTGGNLHTWFVEKTATGWGEAQLFDWPAGDGFAMYVTVSDDATLYATSAHAIYKAEWADGQYAQPERLGQQINALPNAAHPYIAPDGHYLIFGAQVGGPMKSSLYVSFRLDDGSWSTPQKMGDEINATETEMCASVSPDGKVVFFSREVDGKRDIYWVDARIIDAYRPAPAPPSTGEGGADRLYQLSPRRRQL